MGTKIKYEFDIYCFQNLWQMNNICNELMKILAKNGT